jgi:NAD-dependent dihydropyrimidine dehydrogenase PreA subunit
VSGKTPPAVIRPPGAAPRAFNALCARCGNCMRACPYGLIVPDLGASGVDGLFTPVLKFRSLNPAQEQFCFQECNACTQVCPTGAIRALARPTTRSRPRSASRAWTGRPASPGRSANTASSARSLCPYQAIIEKRHRGVNCPIVDEDKCRGCGACESQCPASRSRSLSKAETPDHPHRPRPVMPPAFYRCFTHLKVER